MPSQSMDAVLEIANSCVELKIKMLPHIDIENDTVDFEAILKNGFFESGHTGAVLWAKSIWNRKTVPDLDPMPHSWSMDTEVTSAVIGALCIAWNLDFKISNSLKPYQ